MTGFRQSKQNGGSSMRYGRLTDLVRLAMQMQGRADGLSLDDIGETFEV